MSVEKAYLTEDIDANKFVSPQPKPKTETLPTPNPQKPADNKKGIPTFWILLIIFAIISIAVIALYIFKSR